MWIHYYISHRYPRPKFHYEYTAFLSIEILQFIFKTSLSRPIAVLHHIDSDKNKRSVGYNIVPLSTDGILGLR